MFPMAFYLLKIEAEDVVHTLKGGLIWKSPEAKLDIRGTCTGEGVLLTFTMISLLLTSGNKPIGGIQSQNLGPLPVTVYRNSECV
jgi:hypothetical protein